MEQQRNNNRQKQPTQQKINKRGIKRNNKQPTQQKIIQREMNGRTTNETTNNQHRSEEHTSELQSRLHLVCRLLLEKKNTIQNKQNNTKQITKHN